MMITGRKIRFSTVNVVVILFTTLMISSCIKREDIKDGAAIAFDKAKVGAGYAKKGVGKGIVGIKSLTSGKVGDKRKKNREKALAIVAKYPKNQVPHTLMTKPVAQGSVTSAFGFRFNPAGVPIPKKHNGVDYVAPKGTTIYAAGDGVVVRKYVSSSYGNYIKLEHDNGFTTAYAHMDSFANGMAEGVSVSKGQKIGEVGSTGRSTGPHLHYELHHRGQAIDPFFSKQL